MGSGVVNIIVDHPGMLTTVQDKGRNDFQSLGVSMAGPMDKNAACVANWLVGNELEGPVLEITLLGPRLIFQSDAIIGLAGADLQPMINGQNIEMYQTLHIQKNDVLSFGKRISGCRAYLGIKGLWKHQPWMGSQSYSPQYGEELTPESILKRGNTFQIEYSGNMKSDRSCSGDLFEYSSQNIRVLPGPEFFTVSAIIRDAFLKDEHIISTDCNRMGYRLNTVYENYKSDSEMISSGIIPGTIQLTNAGSPIILMADAQTSGGYPRLANVIKTDSNLLGQKMPGDRVRFQLVSLDQALAINKSWDLQLSKLIGVSN